MAQHSNDELTFVIGDVKALPHTLSETRHLTLTLIGMDAAERTADFELHNPEADPDEFAAGMIQQHRESVEATNHWRDELHLPDRKVPVDTSTMPVVTIHATLHEKLQIGDRVWKVSDIAATSVTLTPGHDFDAHTRINEAIEESGYSPEAIAVAEKLDGIDSAL